MRPEPIRLSTRPVFTEAIESLAPGAFLDHFLTRENVVYPNLSGPTEAQLANARKVLENRFDLIGEEYVLPEGFSWKQNPSRDKEWQIAHHKFYLGITHLKGKSPGP